MQSSHPQRSMPDQPKGIAENFGAEGLVHLPCCCVFDSSMSFRASTARDACPAYNQMNQLHCVCCNHLSLGSFAADCYVENKIASAVGIAGQGNLLRLMLMSVVA